MQIIKELEFCDENSFSLIFTFRKLDLDDAEAMCREVADEFAAVKGDPELFKEAEKIAKEVATRR